jgi:hypothetical protein
MKPRGIFLIVASAMALMANHAYSSELVTNSESEKFFFSPEWTNLVSINNAIADLGTQLNWSANEDITSEFDKQVCKSLGIRPKSAVIVAYKEVSFVLHSTKTNEWLRSHQEMVNFSKLICQNGKIVRTNTDEQIPSNEIYLFDPKVKELTVEIELLISVAPFEKPQEVKYARRSFRFAHRNRWVAD